MNTTVITKTYNAPTVSEKDILRYANCKSNDTNIISIMREYLKEAENNIIYKVCYKEFPLIIENGVCNLGSLKINSDDLMINLKDCDSVILFAATIGVGIDRLITRYSSVSPTKALFFQAIGAERIEALCDTFCSDIKEEYHAELKPRFSPGYGDLPLNFQKDIFSCLDCEKCIGLYLNDSLLMSPSKSVTAFIGIKKSGVAL